MSRRARARREAMEARYIAMAPSDDTDDMDWYDADHEMLATYRDAEAIDSETSTYQHDSHDSTHHSPH